MNRRLRNGLLVVLLFSLIANVVLCAKLSGLLLKFHTLSHGEMISKQDRSPDHSYKLFYGEWVITDVIETNLMEPEAVERAKDKRGEKYYFDESKITIDDETFCELPQYNISMIPTTEWQRSAGRTFPIFDYTNTRPCLVLSVHFARKEKMVLAMSYFHICAIHQGGFKLHILQPAYMSSR